ncbi:MAG TPA: four helix bundle protein [Armatimonadota bacterium]|nr:four helix bundle protein [Armatimonadota bacterium]
MKGHRLAKERMMRDYTKIKAFQKADDLVVRVYQVTQTWPKEEQYGLTSQVRRAAVSVASEIVEGSGRRHLTEYLQFTNRGYTSLREVGYQLYLGHRLGYVDDATYAEIKAMHEEAIRVLWGLVETIAGQLGQHSVFEMLKEERADYVFGERSADSMP